MHAPNTFAHTLTACDGLRDLLIFDAALVGLAYARRLWWCGSTIDFSPIRQYSQTTTITWRFTYELSTHTRARASEFTNTYELCGAKLPKTGTPKKQCNKIFPQMCMGDRHTELRQCVQRQWHQVKCVVSLHEAKEVVEPSTAFKSW